MRILALKMKSYGARAREVSIVNNGNLQRRIFNMMLVSFGALAVFYVLLLGTTVINIVERRAHELAARSLGTEVAELELTYLSISNKIDGSLGAALGFKEKEIKFTTPKSLGSLEGAKVTKNEI
jgi:hypothetical protein